MTTLSSADAWKRYSDEIMAIADEAVQRCTIPREVAVQEALQLAIVAAQDREVLTGAGIDPELVDSLRNRAMALDMAAAISSTAIDTSGKSEEAWKAAVAEGYRLRKSLLKQLRFAFRDDPERLSTVAGIQEGRGHYDMMVDLLALYLLCAENEAALAPLGFFDMTAAQQSKTLHATLNELAARARIRPKTLPTAKSAFHRAWTFYRQAADEVKSYGQFLFEGTDRYSLYCSTWQKKLGKRGGKVSPASRNAAINTPKASPEEQKAPSSIP